MILKAVILVEPIGKGRPRYALHGQHVTTYTPKATRKSEAEIVTEIRRVLMDQERQQVFGAGIALRLEATFYRQRPKSLAKRVQLPIARPDYDNHAKILTDALNKFCYYDDAQITTALIRKRFGTPPRIELVLEEDKEV